MATSYRIKKQAPAFVALMSITIAAAAQQSPIAKAEAAINAERMREQVKLIADDKFQGRYPGQPGGDMAAKYIAAEFAKYGLQPAGDNGTFLQQINFVGMTAKPAETKFALIKNSAPGGEDFLRFGDDYTVSNQTLTAVATLDAPIVFVGYGAAAPEFQWDDYAGVDVKGKVILCIVGDPPSTDPKFFGGDAMTYYGRWTYKFEQAARMGAVGALIIHRTDLASYGWSVVKNSNTSEKTFLRDDTNPRLKAASWIQLDVAKKIFGMSGFDFDKEFAAAGQRGFKAHELPVRLKATVTSEVRPFQSPNVVGMIRGESCGGRDGIGTRCKPGLEQAVLYTAHYDHLGVRTGSSAIPGGDNIYNGAADNGTGVGILLELAEAWASLAEMSDISGPSRPGGKLTVARNFPHSVIFSAVTAEEQGLLGSEYLGQHPPIPASQISLDINFDMLLPVGVQQEINVNGAQRTTFFPEVKATAKRFGLAIVPDPFPSHGSYYRSDHFSLSRVGIPAFSVDAGTLYQGHDHAWGAAQEKDFNEHRYHDVTDNFDPTWDFHGDANLARFGMDLGWQVIHRKDLVEWNAGDEFERARKASEAK